MISDVIYTNVILDAKSVKCIIPSQASFHKVINKPQPIHNCLKQTKSLKP